MVDITMLYPLLKPFIDTSVTLNVKRGSIIYHEGDTPKSLYLIEEGLIGLFHISDAGKETFLRAFGKNCIFGHRSYFAEAPYHATSIALEATRLTVISKKQCQDLCLNNPEVLKEMTKLIAIDLGNAELRLAGLQDKSAPARIAEALIYLKLKYPKHIWTRKEIAEFAGSTFESVTRLMTKLSELGLITKEGRDFKIVDAQKILELERHQG